MKTFGDVRVRPAPPAPTPCTPSSYTTVIVNRTMFKKIISFCSLGSFMTNDSCLEREIHPRIRNRTTTFSQLNYSAWHNPHLALRTKDNFCKAFILSTLFHSCETFPRYIQRERKLDSFHIWCIQSIYGITWMDKIRNEVILQHNGCSSLFSHLQRELAWINSLSFLWWTVAPEVEMLTILSFKDAVQSDLEQLNISLFNGNIRWKVSGANSFAKVSWTSTLAVLLNAIILSRRVLPHCYSVWANLLKILSKILLKKALTTHHQHIDFRFFFTWRCWRSSSRICCDIL